MLLEEALAEIPGIELRGGAQVSLRGISYDSRLVKKGHLFVAIKGETTDGALFIPQAAQRGACAIAAEEYRDCDDDIPFLKVADARRFLAEVSRVFYQDPAPKLKLVAVTGTNGKTTTSFLADEIFRQAGFRSCLVGTVGMKIAGRPFPSERTTPEASDLTMFLRRSVDAGCTHGVLEVSSHALALKRVFGTRFTVGVFSNLTPDHLDFHHDMESYYQAKRLLFVPEGENRIEAAVINVDDPYGRRLVSEIPGPVVSYGMTAPANIHVLECSPRMDGTHLCLATHQGEIDVETRLVGRPNVYNIMAAVGAAQALDIVPDAIRLGIEKLAGVPGRMEIIDQGQPFTIIVDYAHTPDALDNLLETVTQLNHRRVITVFGCGGDRDRIKRPVMGRIAGAKSDYVIATSDNPRSEDPDQILAEIEAGLRDAPAPYQMIPDRRKAIETALKTAESGDVIVIAGKGHEDYQIIGTRAYPFDDRRVARDFLFRFTRAGGKKRE